MAAQSHTGYKAVALGEAKMDFSQIRYFLALAETLHFTRAAKQCNVTQPTLTQAIKRLEGELGGPLVLREGRNTRLTALGKVLRGHFEQIEGTRRTLKETATAITSGDQVELNIGLMCTIGPRIISPFLDDFRRSNHHINLHLHDVTPGSIPDLLLTGAIDGAFCARHSERHERLDYVPLFRETMVVAFGNGHQFERTSTVTLTEIADEPYVDRLHCEFRDEINALCAQEELVLDVVFNSQREDWIQSMISENVGVSILPEYSLISSGLKCRPLTMPDMEREVEFATVNGGPKGPGLRALMTATERHAWLEQISSFGAID